MKHHCGVIHCLSAVQHGEIVHRALCLYCIISKGHIRRGEGLAVGELHVIPDGDRPGQAILADLHVSGQVIANAHIRIGDHQRALDQRLMHMLARTPAIRRVKAGCRFGFHVHCHHHSVGLLLAGGAGRSCGLAGRLAAARGTNRQAQGHDRCKDFRFFHARLSFPSLNLPRRRTPDGHKKTTQAKSPGHNVPKHHAFVAFNSLVQNFSPLLHEEATKIY